MRKIFLPEIAQLQFLGFQQPEKIGKGQTKVKQGNSGNSLIPKILVPTKKSVFILSFKKERKCTFTEIYYPKNNFMKKVTLLLVLCFLSLAAFSQAVLTATGASGSYTTGSATASTRTDDAIISTSTTQNGYAVFDLSSIPVGSEITSCRLSFYVSSFTPGVAGVCNTYGFAGDLSAVTTPATLFSHITV